MNLDQIRKIRLDLSQSKINVKFEEENPIDLESYPWEDCISDNTPKYGTEGAKKVCGAIKAMYGTKQDPMGKDIDNGLKLPKKEGFDITPNPCWKGYEPIGLKDDGSPNCVPVKNQKFIIPKPEGGEKESDYISRCMKALKDENKPQDQKLAICYAQLEK